VKLHWFYTMIEELLCDASVVVSWLFKLADILGIVYKLSFVFGPFGGRMALV
jgi:hypothetical protein